MKNASTVSEDTASNQEPTLHRGLHNRHIQLIALGGAIGTGLFLGIGPAIQMAGPAVLLGYGVAGIIAFLIMRQLGEMVVEEPVSGSFAHFAYKYWGPFAGFLSGWNYWVMFVLVGMAELTAAGIYMQYWFPDVPTWIWAAAFFIIINAVNLVNVRLYGETEFWFALIKVLAIIGMIGFGLWLLFSGHGGEKASIDNLWRYGGFFATGWNGLILSLAVIMFSFGGLELIGITAAEARDPEKSIPKAVNQVVYRILLFYIAFQLDDTAMITICTGVMGIVGLMMVHRTCQPYNTIRKVMIVVLGVLFVIAYFGFPTLFSLEKLNLQSALILIVFGLLSWPVMKAFCRLNDHMRAKFEAWRAGKTAKAA